MNYAYARIRSSPGVVKRISAKEYPPLPNDTNLICPECGETVFFIKAGEDQPRAAHFRHQRRELSDTEDCDLRSAISENNDKYISQKLRTPIFLRQQNDGTFVVSIGFASADKELLHKLKLQNFQKLKVTSASGSKGDVSIDELLEAGDTAFLDLDAPIGRHADYSVVAQGISGGISGELPASKANPEWADTVDWFGSSNCHGAIFEYGTGNAGKKIRAGGFVMCGRDYLMIEKASGKDALIEQSLMLDKLTEAGTMDRQPIGTLRFSTSSVATYTVFRVRFHDFKDCTKQKGGHALYVSMAEYLQEHFAVILRDILPETRAVWPPASQCCDAYSVPWARNKEVVLFVSGFEYGQTLMAHKNAQKAVPLTIDRKSRIVVLAELDLTTMRTPVSVGPVLASAINSYKLGCPENMPRPRLAVTVNGCEPVVFDAPGEYEVPAAEYVVQSSSGGILTNELGVPLTLAPSVPAEQSGSCVVELVPGMKIVLSVKEDTHQQNSTLVVIHDDVQGTHSADRAVFYGQNKYLKYRKAGKYHG